MKKKVYAVSGKYEGRNWESVRDAAREIGIPYSRIYHAISHGHVAAGSRWSYTVDNNLRLRKAWESLGRIYVSQHEITIDSDSLAKIGKMIENYGKS